LALMHIYLLLFALLVVEGIGVPGVPFEAAFIAAAYYIDRGEMSLLGVVLVGGTGNLIGNVIGYWLGARIVPWLMKRSKSDKLERGRELAQSWFERYGAAVVVISRWFGIIRTPTIVCAAAMGMKPLPYTVYSSIGAFSWTFVWQYGCWKGMDIFLYWWRLFAEHAPLWAKVLLVASLLLLIVAAVYGYLLWRKRRAAA
jgi:membrane protein DedA with SNARE-associated domain